MNPFSAAPDTPGLKVRWGDGWIEDFPEDEFAEECKDRPGRVRMYHRKGEKCLAEYSLLVRGTEAFLDYGGHFRDANTAPDRELYIGITRIRFTDESRTIVRDVRWRDEDKQTFRDYDILASWSSSAPTSPFSPPAFDHRKRGLLSSVLRPGQLRFRRMLLKAYGSSCCMTGTTIEETLEAAHIMPYRGTEFDHPENGLLLRSDLHRLFDRLLISVNPETLAITLAAVLQNDPQYSTLAKRRLSISSRSTKPSIDALRDHWHRFKKSTQQVTAADTEKQRGFVLR